MTTYTEQDSTIAIDEALATMPKIFGSGNAGFAFNPHWVYDGMDAIGRVHERAAQEPDNSFIQEMANFIGPADGQTVGHTVGRIVFTQQLAAAHLVNKLLRSRGIDPASL